MAKNRSRSRSKGGGSGSGGASLSEGELKNILGEHLFDTVNPLDGIEFNRMEVELATQTNMGGGTITIEKGGKSGNYMYSYWLNGSRLITPIRAKNMMTGNVQSATIQR